MKALRTQHGLLMFVAIALLVLTPLFLVAIPPMVDYPNHLARCSILADLPSHPGLANLYSSRDALLPNMAMDAIVVPLARIMPVVLAGRIFCGLVLMAIFSGSFALSLALYRRLTFWSFAPALLLFNHIYTFGFLNYMLGVGLLLWGLTAWIAMREGKTWARLLVAGAIALVLFFSHLVALFLFGCAILGWEIGRWRSSEDRRPVALVRELVGLAVVFALPFVLLLTSPTHSEASKYFADSVGTKLDQVAKMLRVDGTPFDRGYTYLIFFAVVGLIAAKSLRIEPRMRWPIGLVTVAFLLLPSAFATCACVDVRVPIVIALMLAAGTSLRNMTRMTQVCAGVLVVAFALRTAQVTEVWMSAQRTSSQVVADFSQLPANSIVFSAADRAANLYGEDSWQPPMAHLPLLAVANKQLFFPQIFALPTQHPLAVRPELTGLQKFQATDPKYFTGGENLGIPMKLIRTALSDPKNLPPNLGTDPGVYVYVVTQDRENLAGWGDAELVVHRDRYAIFKLTNLANIYAMRDQYWRLGPNALPQALVMKRSNKLARP